MAFDYCVNGTTASCYLRLESVPTELPFNLPANYQFSEGRGATITEGRDAVLFAYGPTLLAQAFKAASRLSVDHGFTLRVVNLPWINRIDPKWLREALGDCKRIITLDNHYLAGGLGQAMAVALESMSWSNPPQLVSLGIADVPTCGTNDEVLGAHKLSAEGLVERIRAEFV